AKSSTPSPTASTVPHPSWPGAPGLSGYENHGRPSHTGRLEPQTPQPSRRTRTSPAAGARISMRSMARAWGWRNLTARHSTASSDDAGILMTALPGIRLPPPSPAAGRHPAGCRGELAAVADVVTLVAAAPAGMLHAHRELQPLRHEVEQLEQAQGVRGAAADVECLSGEPVDAAHRQQQRIHQVFDEKDVPHLTAIAIDSERPLLARLREEVRH